MTALRRPGLAVLNEDRPLPAATFKNSLRSWQARWQAQKAAQTSAAQEADKRLDSPPTADGDDRRNV